MLRQQYDKQFFAEFLSVLVDTGPLGVAAQYLPPLGLAPRTRAHTSSNCPGVLRNRSEFVNFR
jgi:hypothetical protein